MLQFVRVRKSACRVFAFTALAALAACGGDNTPSQSIPTPTPTPTPTPVPVAPTVANERYVFIPAQGLQTSSTNGVLANDRPGQSGTTLRAEFIGLSPSGVCSNANVLSADGSISCLPAAAGAERVGTLSYAAVDASNTAIRSTATATLVRNRAPTAVSDTVTVPFDVGTNGQSNSTCTPIDVLANDTDADGDTLTILSAAVDTAGGTAPGTVQILDRTRICYRPAVNAAAIVRYTIVDNFSIASEAVQASVTISVGPRADQDGQVIGNTDTINIRKGQLNSIEPNLIFANDTIFGDPALGATYASQISAELVPGSGPRNHRTTGFDSAGVARTAFKLESTGAFKYDHDASSQTANIADSFQYRLVYSDTRTTPPTKRTSSPTTVVLPLVDTNPPFAGAEEQVTLNPSETRSVCGDNRACIDIPVMYNDFDIDDGVLTFDGVTSLPSFGTVDISRISSAATGELVGVLRYTLTGVIGSQTQDSFRYRVRDSTGNTDEGVVTINFNASSTNTPPSAPLQSSPPVDVTAINVFPGRASGASTIRDENRITAAEAQLNGRAGILGTNAFDGNGDLLITSKVGNCSLADLAASRCTPSPVLKGKLELVDVKRGLFSYTPPADINLPSPFVETTSYEVADGRGGTAVGQLQLNVSRTTNLAPVACSDPSGGAAQSSQCIAFHADNTRLHLFEAPACGAEVFFNVMLNDLDANPADRPVGFTMLPDSTVAGEAVNVPAASVVLAYQNTSVFLNGTTPRRALSSPSASAAAAQQSDGRIANVRTLDGLSIGYSHIGAGTACVVADAPDFDTFTYVMRDQNGLNSQPVTVRVKLNKGVPSATAGATPVFFDTDKDGVKDCVDGLPATPGMTGYVITNGRRFCSASLGTLDNAATTDINESSPPRMAAVLAQDQCPGAAPAAGAVVPTVFANGCAPNVTPPTTP